MAGFILRNTLSDNGGVTRGVCQMDKDFYLTKVTETHNIVKTHGDVGFPDGATVIKDNGKMRDSGIVLCLWKKELTKVILWEQ